MRLDAYLAKNFPEYSRAVWAKYIKAGFVSVGGRTTTGSDLVNDKDEIKISLPKNDIKPLDFPIIYEDDNVVVINKPTGVLTHSKGAINTEFTVADFIKSRAKNSDLTDNNRFGIVHRLDRATSGVIIGAKNADTLHKLQKQFADRKVKKTYLAIVAKKPENSEFVIDLPIARNPKHPSEFRVDPKGKSALTYVKLRELLNNGAAILELKPQTGRTHQLRVHLAHIGLPILGDPVYGGRNGASRMMLHAQELEITIPNGQRMNFIAKTPKEFHG